MKLFKLSFYWRLLQDSHISLSAYFPNCGAKMDGKLAGELLYADMEEIIDGSD